MHTRVKCWAVLLHRSCFGLPGEFPFVPSRDVAGQAGCCPVLAESQAHRGGSPSRVGAGTLQMGDSLNPDPAGFCSAAPALAPSLFWEMEHWRWTRVLRK